MIDLASDTEGDKKKIAITQYKWIQNADSWREVAEHLIGHPTKMQMLLKVEANQQGQNLSE